jgi:hypothetical protein
VTGGDRSGGNPAGDAGQAGAPALPIPLLALSGLLLVIAMVLIGLAAAGPERRARLLKPIQPALDRVRAIAKPRPSTVDRG